MRIIAGKHKGLVLNTFEADNIRPTIDRVREGIFSKIQFDIPNAKVLDLFAGTGAISLEFLSRGANSVISVDNNKNSINLIKKNFVKAKENVNLITCDYLEALNKFKGTKFDIVFLDPPFSTDFGEKAICKISENQMIENDGIIIYEHLVGKEFDIPNNFKLLDEKKYGTIIVSYIGVNNA